MFNNFPFNTKPFNALFPNAVPQLSEGEILYNDYELTDTNFLTSDIDFYNAPSRDLKTRRIPRDHGRLILGDYYDQKIIKLKGRLVADSATLLVEKIDEMKKNLSAQNGNLDALIDGQLRRYVGNFASLNKAFPIRRHYNITFIDYDLEFEVLKPFGESKLYASKSLFAQTDQDLDEQVNNSGTFESDAVLILIITAATAITGLTFTNNTREEAIQITNALTAGDVIEIDGEQRTVKLNSVEIDFDGFFPKFSVGRNSINLTIAGTSIEYDLTAKFKKNYL